MSSQPSRRKVLHSGAAAAAGAIAFPYVITAQVRGANEKIRTAHVGVGGKGGSDIDHCAAAGAEIVALCDVDERTLNNKAAAVTKARAEKSPDAKFPELKLYRDFRKMYDEIGNSFDAVTVSTPDHVHGVAAGRAMLMGKHVYCQKPFVQTVYEARTLRRIANEKKLATQMGNQGSAEPGLRRAVEVIHAGIIGNVTELHVWSNRPIWPQGIERPKGEDSVPESLDWDLWLGPAKKRPYKQGVYHPFAWRGWNDFGTGALGDMACHTVNMPFRALKMGYPTVVELEMATRLYSETFPKSSRIRFEFPEREGMVPLKFWWYDGNPTDDTISKNPLRPAADVVKDVLAMRGRLPPSGALLIGDKGTIFSPDDYGAQFYLKLKGEEKFLGSQNHDALKAIPENYPRPVGDGRNGDQNMKNEWFKAMREGTPTYSNFDIAGYLTETILLGCIAMRMGEGESMQWDGPNMKSTNLAEAAHFVKRESRPGWEI